MNVVDKQKRWSKYIGGDIVKPILLCFPLHYHWYKKTTVQLGKQCLKRKSYKFARLSGSLSLRNLLRSMDAYNFQLSSTRVTLSCFPLFLWVPHAFFFSYITEYVQYLSSSCCFFSRLLSNISFRRPSCLRTCLSQLCFRWHRVRYPRYFWFHLGLLFAVHLQSSPYLSNQLALFFSTSTFQRPQACQLMSDNVQVSAAARMTMLHMVLFRSRSSPLEFRSSPPVNKLFLSMKAFFSIAILVFIIGFTIPIFRYLTS